VIDFFAEKPDPVLYGAFNETYDREELKIWLEKLKVEHDLLKEHSGRWLHFVAVDYPEIKESLSPQELMELKEKAGKYDETKAELDRFTLDADKEIQKLEAVKGIVYHEGLHPLSAILRIKGLLEAKDHSEA